MNAGEDEGYRVRALEKLGGYCENPAFAEFTAISHRAFELYHGAVREGLGETPIADLIRRMMYVAEASSVGLRLVASWALSHPGFSLCRDRFEQCVRFSWLARQQDSREWYRYIADYYLTRHRLQNAIDSRGINFPGKLDEGLAELSPEIRKKFTYWRNTSLEQMVSSRDTLPGITSSTVDKESLTFFYESIYRQGSSVAHYDLHSINMLGLHAGPDGPILAPDPYLPIVVVLHCAIFDIIQCAEAVARAEGDVPVAGFETLLERWWSGVRQTGMLDDPAIAPK